MDKLKFLLVLIVLLTVGVVITQLRWRIPVVKEWFITIGVHDHLTSIETSVLDLLRGNPQALAGIVTGSVTLIVALIKAFKDKTSSLINTFSSEKADLTTQMNDLMGLRSQLEQTVTEQKAQLDTAYGTLQNQQTTFDTLLAKKDAEIKTLTDTHTTLQSSIIDLQAQLKDVTTERDAYLITLTQHKQATMH